MVAPEVDVVVLQMHVGSRQESASQSDVEQLEDLVRWVSLTPTSAYSY